MYFFQDKKGFSLIELMIAVMVLVIGLTGVAGMQISALNGTFFANSNSSGSGIALAWAEWLNGQLCQPDQEKFTDPNTGMWNRQNLLWLASFDSNPNDQAYVEVQLPLSTTDLVAFFNTQKTVVVPVTLQTITLSFRKEGGTAFTIQDMPPPAPAGAHLVLRIAANVPVINTTSIEVSIPYTNAFVNNQGATLHFVVASSM